MRHAGPLDELINRQSFFDELIKIAEDTSSTGGLGRALRSAGIAAAGGALGFGAAELLGNKMSFFKPKDNVSPSALTAARIILPILSGTAVMLADKYRQSLNKEYRNGQ